MAWSRSRDGRARPSWGRARARRLVGGALILALLGTIGHGSTPWFRREFHARLAGRAIRQGRLADAESRLDLLIHEQPTRPGPRLLMVQVLRRQGRITEAEELLQRAIELGLPVEEGRREFALLAAESDFPRSERSLRRALERDPGDIEVRRALERRHTRQGSRSAPR